MTDLIPNDLSHMSDEDFNALCPQGHHAPGPEPLSPAAQAVLTVFRTHPIRADHIAEDLVPALAAALLAVADQVVPVTSSRTAAAAGKRRARAELLAIAAELKGHHE